MIEGINETTQLVIGVCTATALLAGAYKVLWYGKRNPRQPGWVKGFLLDMRGFRDAILGREAVVDSITREIVQAELPGIGVRMAHQETQMAEVTRALTTLVDQGKRLNDHETQIGNLRSDVTALQAASVERIVTKAESAAAWRAVEAATLATPDQVVED